ncbi:hypothetical protein ScPMuIL_009505 [Solemya velum]
MAEQTDLDWDHTGESLEENPLLSGFKAGHSTFYSDHRTGLTYGQTEQLLNTLDDATAILRLYMSGLDRTGHYQTGPNERRHFGDTCCRTPICVRISSFFKWLVPKITGAKSIIFTVILQALNIFILSVIDLWTEKKDEEVVVVVGSVTMIVLHVLNLLLIIITSVRLAQQLQKRRVSGTFLLQSYLASILLFSGIYTMTYRLKPRSWKFVYEDISQDPILVIVLYFKFLFYSVSTGTLCGSSNAVPEEWYNCIFASLQMLLSFMHFASILGHTFSPPYQETSQRVRRGTRSRQPTVSHSGEHYLETSDQIHPEQVPNYGSISNST